MQQTMPTRHPTRMTNNALGSVIIMSTNTEGHVYATFQLWSKDLNPDEITARLKLTPSISFRAGDQRGLSNRTWPHGYWGFTSQNEIPSKDLAVHLEWLLNQIEPAGKEIIQL